MIRRSYILDKKIYHFLNLIKINLPTKYDHCLHVAEYSFLLGKKLGFPKDRLSVLYTSAIIHDIGYGFIPKEIFEKYGSLSKNEREYVNSHTILGKEALSLFPELKEVSLIVLRHHERVDGNGYPFHIKGDNIPYESKIISIADAFDALTMKRNYERQYSVYEAFEELRSCKGTRYDPVLVEQFIRTIHMEKEKLSKINHDIKFKIDYSKCEAE